MIVTIRSRAFAWPSRLAARMRSRREEPPALSRVTTVGRTFRVRWLAALVVAGSLLVVLSGTGYRYRELTVGEATTPTAPRANGEIAPILKEQKKLRSRVEHLAPRGDYIVVDRANNRLYLKRGEKILLEAVCSSGSGSILKDPRDDRQWVFDTPAGRFHVLKKIEDPAWRRPDWAFIEEGLPVPRDPGDRIEYGVLGEYGLYFGDGYLIHGTLYERLLGRSVTHGCVRLGREDLQRVFRASRVGTPIYIY